MKKIILNNKIIYSQKKLRKFNFPFPSENTILFYFKIKEEF
jgi:hypothetical protein